MGTNGIFMIFPADITLAMLNATTQDNMAAFLGIEYTHIGPDFLEARMPLTAHTRQPQGFLNGGASVALAEIIGTTAASLCIDRTQYCCLGLDINANHVRKVREGVVSAVAKPLHIGRTTHVWQIHSTNQDQKLVCASRLTVAVVPIAQVPIAAELGHSA